MDIEPIIEVRNDTLTRFEVMRRSLAAAVAERNAWAKRDGQQVTAARLTGLPKDGLFARKDFASDHLISRRAKKPRVCRSDDQWAVAMIHAMYGSETCEDQDYPFAKLTWNY